MGAVGVSPCWHGAGLAPYLRHLVNADAMLGDLVALLDRQPQGGAFCFFGDHQPAMSPLFAALDVTDPRTDYLIWSNRTACAPGTGDRALGAHELADRLKHERHRPSSGVAAGDTTARDPASRSRD